MSVLNRVIAAALPIVPKSIVGAVSRRYIAGATLDDGVRVVRQLNAAGAMATVDVLGEFVQNLEEAHANAVACVEVLERLHAEQLDSSLSIKLTSFGLGQDTEQCEANVRLVLDKAAELGSFVRFDMENSPYTEATIKLYLKLRQQYPRLGIVMQAYLKRTYADIERMVADSAQTGAQTNVRLCKGIYVESEAIAIKDRVGIQQNYARCLRLLFEHQAYVGIATHDDEVISMAKHQLTSLGLTKEQYEFQMLLGVRENVRAGLLSEGHRVRVYVPFGKDWYGYSIRRLKENPSMAGYIFKALITGGKS